MIDSHKGVAAWDLGSRKCFFVVDWKAPARMDYESDRRGGEGDVPYRERGRMPRNGRANAGRRDRSRGGGGRGRVSVIN